jgi:DNA repair protein RadC
LFNLQAVGSQSAGLRLKAALELVEVRLIDYVITGAGELYSLAEYGLL